MTRTDETQEIPSIETMRGMVSNKGPRPVEREFSPWACPGYTDHAGSHLAPRVDTDENTTSTELTAIEGEL